MSFAAAAGRLENSLFASGGSDARWYPGGSGAGLTCQVLEGQQDEAEGFGAERAVLSNGMLRVRRSEIAEPADGDKVEILDDQTGQVAETRKIIGTPMLARYRYVWICEAPPQATP